GIPADLLAEASAALLTGVDNGTVHADAVIDIDDNRNAGFPPSLGIVSAAHQTSNDRVIVGSTRNDGVYLQFFSEVSNPELGLPHEGDALTEVDLPAPLVIVLGQNGLYLVRDQLSQNLMMESPRPTLPVGRLAAIVSGALIAVASQSDPTMFQFSNQVLAQSDQVASAGDFLPMEDQFRPGRSFLEIFADTEGDVRSGP
ncbi:MAG: hypothetical protein Q7S68_01545, partial [Deltaproteobacteria bacterium]|nr:hypothetical protein [Deltaproteobacteria bacterium]